MKSQSEGVVAQSEVEFYYKLDNILLISCQNLQSVFKVKWKSITGNDWVNDKEHGEKLINSLNKQTKKLVQKGGGENKIYQRKFSSGNVEDWDISVLSMALQNMKITSEVASPSSSGAPPTNEYSQLHEAVQNLKDLRNFVVSHSTKQLSKDEYNANLDKFEESMKTLKVTEPEIKRIIGKAGVSSSALAMKKVDELHKKAAKLIKTKKFEKAMECYEEAIATPSLLPLQISSIYEMRAQDYLKISDGKLEFIVNALKDLDEALILNKFSWNAHYLVSQGYRKLGDYHEAIEHLQKSLAISPNQKHVKKELDEVIAQHGHAVPCRTACSEKKKDEHSITHLPNERKALEIPGQHQVLTGHRYSNGWNIFQNDVEAMKQYEEAAQLGNAEGIYNLAMCYKMGKGVAQDIEKSLLYFRQAAAISPDHPGDLTLRKKNRAVAFSQLAIGIFCENGIGVKQNFQEAAEWYQKGMEYGCPSAANNMGNLYSRGDGVPEKDEKKAALCWKEAFNLQDEHAPFSLINYYLREREPNLALAVYKAVKERKIDNYKNVSQKEFDMRRQIVVMMHTRELPEVEEFEQENNLEIKGLTFAERRHRMIASNPEQLGKLKEVPQFLKHLIEYPSDRRASCSQRLFEINSFTNGDIIDEIKKRADDGSIVAKRVVSHLLNCARLVEIRQNEAPFYKEEDTSKIIELLYNSVTLPFDEFIMQSEEVSKIQQIIQHIFEKMAGGEEEIDKKIRLIYAVFNKKGQDDNAAVELLQEGIRRHTENHFYYFHLAKVYERMGQHTAAVQTFREGLMGFPSDMHFLFGIAKNLWQKNKERASVFATGKEQEIVKSFQKYLEEVPLDEIHVPEAHFAIAHCQLKVSLNQAAISDEIMNVIEESYRSGVESEQRQLPCLERKYPTDKGVLDFFFRLTYKQPVPKYWDSNASIFEQKPYLRVPSRKMLILHFRQKYHDKIPCTVTTAPPFQQIMPERAAHLKPISLQEMYQTSDQIFYDRILDLTIIENPILGNPSIHLLAEDENGDVCLFYVYNISQNDPNVVDEKLGFGCKVAVINPYLRVAMDWTIGIRNDEPRCLIYLGRVVDMCRVCGKGAATYRCAKCLVANYCCKECQQFDWKEFGHKNICRIIAKG